MRPYKKYPWLGEESGVTLQTGGVGGRHLQHPSAVKISGNKPIAHVPQCFCLACWLDRPRLVPLRSSHAEEVVRNTSVAAGKSLPQSQCCAAAREGVEGASSMLPPVTFLVHCLTVLINSEITMSTHFRQGSLIFFTCFFTMVSNAMSGVKRPVLNTQDRGQDKAGGGRRGKENVTALHTHLGAGTTITETQHTGLGEHHTPQRSPALENGGCLAPPRRQVLRAKWIPDGHQCCPWQAPEAGHLPRGSMTQGLTDVVSGS